jgi:hypothetical protein
MTRLTTTTAPRIAPEKRAALVGATALVGYGALTFQVKVKQHRVAYGTDRWLVSPVSGSGEAWLQNLRPLAPRVSLATPVRRALLAKASKPRGRK